MNKIKFLYDVVTTIKEKEVFNGTLQAQVNKNQETIFLFDNEFQKNITTGETKVKISTDINHDGKKVKHESQTEFSSKCCHGGVHGHILKHMHQCHHNAQCTFKEKLSKLAFLLNVFNNIKLSEEDGKGFALSLNLSEIPEDMKKAFHEKMQNKMMQKESHCCCKEFQNAELSKFELNMWFNKKFEVEKAVISVQGTKTCEDGTVNNIDVGAELNLLW